MKKMLIILFTLTVLLTGCATMVSFNALAPSEVSLGANQVIAVASTSQADTVSRFGRPIPFYSTSKDVPIPQELCSIYSDYDYFTSIKTAEYASQAVYSALSEGVYEIVSPAATDKYMKETRMTQSLSSILQRNGITLLLESSIDSMDYDEYITGKALQNKEGKKYYEYYLCRSARLSLSYRLTDVSTNKVVDAKTFSGREPEYSDYDEILIARIDETGKFTFRTRSFSNPVYMFQNILDGFKSGLRDRLVPHMITLNFSLKDTQDKRYEEINRLVSDGYINLALDQFRRIYTTTNEFVAGYNYAVLTYATGEYEEAVSIADGLYKATYNPEAGKLLERLKRESASSNYAKNQIGQ